MNPANLCKAIQTRLKDELSQTLYADNAVRIERIVSQGHCSADGLWYDQDEDEFVALLTGSARLEFQEPEDEIDMQAGDWLVIPAHRRHRVVETAADEDSVWLAVFIKQTAPD